LLSVEDLRVNVASGRRGLFRAPEPVYAVDGVSLSVAGGETLGLVGESGCGKSSLARTIVGINRPSSGTVRGEDGVQYVFQDPYASLNPRRTIRQSLDEALEMRGVPRAERAGEASELMKRVGLDDGYLDRYPHAVSGGQRQRIGIARELAVVRHLSDRVAVMYLGKIVEIGPVEPVYTKPGHPYTVALMSSSPVPDTTQRGRERIVLTGDLPSPKNPPSGCRFRTRCPIGPMTHPEREICVDREPELTETATGQHVACHFAGELAGSA
jgi:peptide/nickel transport system ATP-binding protein